MGIELDSGQTRNRPEDLNGVINPAMGWKPIETAPMDVNLLLYEPDCSIFVGTGSVMSFDNSVYWCGDGTPQRYPTYWMPLPNPPVMENNSQWPLSDDK